MATIDPAIAYVPRQRGRAFTFMRRHPTITIGAVLLLIMALIAILAPWLGTGDPLALAPRQRLRDPSAVNWFGTDMLGRDVYTRTLYGSRVSLVVGLSVAIFSTAIGLAIGLVSGYIRIVDAIVMRIMDGLMSILRLIAWPPGRIVGGSIRFGDRDLLSLSDAEQAMCATLAAQVVTAWGATV